jgi:uncharacterized membrane protein
MRGSAVLGRDRCIACRNETHHPLIGGDAASLLAKFWKRCHWLDRSLVHYASHTAYFSVALAEWGPMRIVFLQYSSDPVVFYDPRSLWRPPPWMRDRPAADMSNHLFFMHVVTQFQLALDMALSFGAPAGRGHAYYAPDYIGPWAEVTGPPDWSKDKSKRLKRHCQNGFQKGCTNGLR